MLLTAVHIDDNEMTQQSVTYHLQHSTELSKDERVNAPVYDRTIVTSQSLQYDFY